LRSSEPLVGAYASAAEVNQLSAPIKVLLSTIPLIMTHGRNGSVRKRRMKKEKIRSRRIVMMKNPTERKEMVLHLRK